uniref:Uncharacterized protein n=1 Tax=Cacopsylla melanoneura TaxID=428564 RepID=A0A8D8XBV5_9HEMI
MLCCTVESTAPSAFLISSSKESMAAFLASSAALEAWVSALPRAEEMESLVLLICVSSNEDAAAFFSAANSSMSFFPFSSSSPALPPMSFSAPPSPPNMMLRYV